MSRQRLLKRISVNSSFDRVTKFSNVWLTGGVGNTAFDHMI
jgi:hypothetical protein